MVRREGARSSARPMSGVYKPLSRLATTKLKANQVRPIFVQHCQGCHQPAKQGGSYVMTGHAELLKSGDKGEPGIVPGKTDKSLIVEQITAHDGKPPAMPKGKDPLIDYQITLIKKW